MTPTWLALPVVALAACAAPAPPASRPPIVPHAPTAPQEPAMQTIEASAAQTKESFDMEAARASVVPAGVSFHLEGPPVLDGRYLRLHGLLANATATAQTVTVFPAGPLGFIVDPAPGTATRRPPPPGGPPPQPPPAPPPPLLITIPAMTQIRITSGLAPDDYDWTGPAPHQLAWSFLFWNEPKPHGTVATP